MKILGIITEYNPFHQGHQFHINKSLEKSNANACICIMSGPFLQRGEPAIVNQWARTKMALNSGVDLLIQLPVTYSVRSAEHFALGAVKLLNSTGIVDSLCFGSELGISKILRDIAKLISDKPKELDLKIKKNMDQGISYPAARSKAISEYIKINSSKFKVSASQAMNILNNPNNILGLEYMKALIKLKSPITPLTIQRKGSQYHSKKLNQLASASAIREEIRINQINNSILINDKIREVIPTITSQILIDQFKNNLGPIFYDNFSTQILTLIRRTSSEELKKYENIIGGLENRIKEAANKATSIQELIDLINTKRFTKTRIQRILTHILLGLDQKTLNNFDQNGGPQYLRILGFNNKGRDLLKLIKQNSTLPLITKVANHFRTNQNPNNLLQEMLNIDIKANNIYALAYPNKQKRQGNIDFFNNPIINIE
ncbi:nucleotidyltransferase [Orenia marismortui]|uniref:nucleotidyltransferase n=1 Tax=Orenia marismortui TaxID=46469 RepID=UPI00035EF1EC|nr:nucleotidyltransferase [Orenia marismortui]